MVECQVHLQRIFIERTNEVNSHEPLFIEQFFGMFFILTARFHGCAHVCSHVHGESTIYLPIYLVKG